MIAHSGKAFRVRTVKRRPLEVRWQADVLKNIKARPRRPDPNKVQAEEVADVEPTALAAEPAADDSNHADQVEEKPATFVETAPEEVRELRLTKRMFEKFEYTPDCIGCEKLRSGQA